jgi:hypothetical protein
MRIAGTLEIHVIHQCSAGANRLRMRLDANGR